jgi:quercetin dioxygenase-like cupin family protein
MGFEFRVLSVGYDENGHSNVDMDGRVAEVTTKALPGVEVYQIWGADDVPVVGPGENEPSFAPYFPDPGGIRYLFLRLPPDGEAEPVSEADLAECGRVFPGVLTALAPDEAGRHRTDTVDVNLILDGELWLELEDGTEKRVVAGDCVVQRGARHAWHNRSGRPALMASVLIGAKRAS